MILMMTIATYLFNYTINLIKIFEEINSSAESSEINKFKKSIRTMVLMLFLFVISLPIYSSSLLIPMDADSQTNHLKAYGITYFALQNKLRVQWLLNYRGGSFLISDTEELQKECKIRGVSYEELSDAKTIALLEEISSPSKNMDAVILEKAPKIAVYAPSGNKPWDDAVTMVLSYAEIPYETIYDEEVLSDALLLYDWLHLHHEDFTGQYGKFYRNYRTTPWYIKEKKEAEALALNLGYKKVLKQAKGYFGRRKNVWTVAKNAVDKAMLYAYRDRKVKKRNFRSLWIMRINAAARLHGMSYSQFMGGMKANSIGLNRKVLADLAMNQPEAFKALVDKVK